MLDKAKPLVRHLLILLAGVVLTWVSAEVVPALNDQGGLAAVVGATVTALLLYLTPLTRQYGIGS